MTSINVIRASVSKNIIANATTLFSNRLETCLSELIQNSRRAGAKHISFDIEKTDGNQTITVTDDGSGIAPEDFKNLISFGESNWSEKITDSEQPAGMGVFALGSRNPIYRSKGLEVELDADVFCGNKEGNIVPSSFKKKGTQVTFKVLKSDHAPNYTNDRYRIRSSVDSFFSQTTENYEIISTICLEATYCGMTFSINGKHGESRNFMDGAIHVFETMGMRIGIFREDILGEYGNNFHGEQRSFNFFGHPVSTLNSHISVADLFPWSKDEPRPIHGHLTNQKTSRKSVYTYRAEFINTETFKPKLPDRETLVETHKSEIPNIDILKNKVFEEIYKIISKNPWHGLTDVNIEQAASLGISLGRMIQTTTIPKTTEYTCGVNTSGDPRIIWAPENPADTKNYLMIENVCDEYASLIHVLVAKGLITQNPNLTPITSTSSEGHPLRMSEHTPNTGDSSIIITTLSGESVFIANPFNENKEYPEEISNKIKNGEKVHEIEVCIGKNLENIKTNVVKIPVIPNILELGQYDRAFYPDSVNFIFEKDAKIIPAKFAVEITDAIFSSENHEEGRYSEGNGEENWTEDLSYNLSLQLFTPKEAADYIISEGLKDLPQTLRSAERSLGKNIHSITIKLVKNKKGEFTTSFRYLEKNKTSN